MEAKLPKMVNFINLGKWVLCGCMRHPCLLASPPVIPSGTGPPVLSGSRTWGRISWAGVAVLLLGHSVVHQPQSLGLRPTQSSACEDELLLQGHPQALRQPLSPSCQDGVGMVNPHGMWGPRGGPGWESAKTSQRTRLG